MCGAGRGGGGREKTLHLVGSTPCLLALQRPLSVVSLVPQAFAFPPLPSFMLPAYLRLLVLLLLPLISPLPGTRACLLARTATKASALSSLSPPFPSGLWQAGSGFWRIFWGPCLPPPPPPPRYAISPPPSLPLPCKLFGEPGCPPPPAPEPGFCSLCSRLQHGVQCCPRSGGLKGEWSQAAGRGGGQARQLMPRLLRSQRACPAAQRGRYLAAGATQVTQARGGSSSSRGAC